jgi:glycosyltransferase involved in cell wall biosynthesis
MIKKHVLIDCREFSAGRKTGIGRFLEGLIDALAAAFSEVQFLLVSFSEDPLPNKLTKEGNIEIIKVPNDFLGSEKALSELSKGGAQLFLSPYPKLPLFDCQCPALHVIHDVLALTHPAYRNRFKAYFDSFRLKRALRRADLTWYVSSWSLEETKNYVGYIGRNPKVRHNGIAEIFTPKKERNEENILYEYQVDPGYILVVGNGLPHKNLGVILEAANQLARKLVFVGVTRENQKQWRLQYPGANAVWISHVGEQDLPAIIRGAFCLAQPSTAEGYGYPPLEAMACGVPAVVSDIPVLVETTGHCALTANPYESETWLEAVGQLANESTSRQQIEKGLKWVEPLLGRRGWQGHILDVKAFLETSSMT